MKARSQKIRGASISYNEKYTDYQLKRNWIRKVIRKFYLNNTLKYVKGKSIDFGCGVGELLKKLPQGSIGFDVNEVTVKYCRNIGLNVINYQPEVDRYELKGCEVGEYKTLIMSHVLEHLENPSVVLHLLLKSCKRLSIEQVIIIVPGKKGFRSDLTHKTFIDMRYLENYHLSDIEGYDIAKTEYFPINVSWIGKYFTHHELIVIYENKT